LFKDIILQHGHANAGALEMLGKRKDGWDLEERAVVGASSLPRLVAMLFTTIIRLNSIGWFGLGAPKKRKQAFNYL
jgi:hypothetical protein